MRRCHFEVVPVSLIIANFLSRIENTVKSPYIFVAKIDNFSSLSQFLKEIDIGNYKIKNKH